MRTLSDNVNGSKQLLGLETHISYTEKRHSHCGAASELQFQKNSPISGWALCCYSCFCVIAIPCNHSPKPLLLISIEKINWSNKFGIVRIITLVFRGSLFLGYISICMSQLLRKKKSVIQFTHMCIGIKYIPGPLLLHVILFQHHGHSLVW